MSSALVRKAAEIIRPAAVRTATLDELWREAESIGRPSLEKSSVWGYYAKIMCDVRGNTCFPECKSKASPQAALAGAIEEARRLFRS